LNRQFGGFCALENAIDIGRHAPVQIDLIDAIGYEPTVADPVPVSLINSWKRSPATSIRGLGYSVAKSDILPPRSRQSMSRWPACSGHGAVRGHPGAPRQEDLVCRCLRFPDRQLEQPSPHHLREICRLGAESLRHRPVLGRFPETRKDRQVGLDAGRFSIRFRA
jgi:hypothetical protein